MFTHVLRSFWDDGSPAYSGTKRHYAFRKGKKPEVSENRWAEFLNLWDAHDLNTATNLVQAHVFADLDGEGMSMLRTLRSFHDVLLVQADDPLHVFQTRLRTMHNYGMINLSMARQHTSTSLVALGRQQRSLKAKLREARKRLTCVSKSAEYQRERADCADAEVQRQRELLRKKDRLLARAKAQMDAFKVSHPDWEPPEGGVGGCGECMYAVGCCVGSMRHVVCAVCVCVELLLTSEDHEDASIIFKQVDTDVSVEQQLKYDPTGCLATFWQEQRRMLRQPVCSRRWHPQVTVSSRQPVAD